MSPNEQKRTSLTFPAEITKRGNAHYVTILKSYMEMLGVQEGSLVDVTISVPKEDAQSGGRRHRRQTLSLVLGCFNAVKTLNIR